MRPIPAWIVWVLCLGAGASAGVLVVAVAHGQALHAAVFSPLVLGYIAIAGAVAADYLDDHR